MGRDMGTKDEEKPIQGWLWSEVGRASRQAALAGPTPSLSRQPHTPESKRSSLRLVGTVIMELGGGGTFQSKSGREGDTRQGKKGLS